MAKELQKLTDEEYTFIETENENQFLFFRNDREPLGEVGNEPIELFALYLLGKVQEGKLSSDNAYRGSIRYEISQDRRIIRLSFEEQKPDLHIVQKKEKNSIWEKISKLWSSKG